MFAGGCFWGTQTVFEHVKGVLKTTAGYDGGSRDTATYAQVTTETTKHAESVEIVFDPSRITYGELLQVFFAIHDPTTLNRQGYDRGTSYRSAIFLTKEKVRGSILKTSKIGMLWSIERAVRSSQLSNLAQAQT